MAAARPALVLARSHGDGLRTSVTSSICPLMPTLTRIVTRLVDVTGTARAAEDAEDEPAGLVPGCRHM